MKKNSKKINIILGIIVVGTITGLLIWCINKDPFIFTPRNTFMDYFNTMRVLENVYSEVGTGRGYFPFTYVILNILKTFLGINLYGYIVVIAIMLFVFAYFIITRFKEEWWKGFIMFVFLCITYPFIFAFERGNVEFIVFIFLILFFLAYNKEKYSVAAILLAFPICMKLYPALFAILFLKDKRIKEFLLCTISSILLMFFSFIAIGGNLNNLSIALENFSYFTNNYAKTMQGLQFSHTMWSGFNCFAILINESLIESSYISSYTIAISIISILLILYIIFVEREEWKNITILTIMMITFPHVSFDYTLIHMYIPIIYFIISESTKKWEEILYSILFGLTIIPMNWFQSIINDSITLNLGLFIRPLILTSIILIIVSSTLEEKRLNKMKKQIKEQCNGN